MRALKFAALAAVALVAAVATIAVAPREAEARQVYQGGDLVKNCAAADICDAFLSGVFDARGALITWTGAKHPICPPRPLTTAEIWPTVATYLQRHPDQLPFYASSITLNAVQESYRCPANATVPAQVLDRVRDATELVSLCQNPALCQAFTIGVIDSHQAFADSKIIRPMVCMPDQAEIRDAMLTVITYVGQHPEALNFSAGSVALTALSLRYPCAR